MAKASGRGWALVTGASAGIGLELAKLAAADGHDVVLVARDAARLAAAGEEISRAHGVRHHVVAADLMDPAAPEALFRAVEDAGIEVEVLVNNAGFGLYGPFVRTGAEAPTDGARELGMLQINVVALTHLSKLFLPGMVARGRGGVLNVASTAAFQPGPLMAVYYASKAYVLSFSQALAVELKETGVAVSTLCPGPTRTEFQKAAAMEESRLFSAPHVMGAAEVARTGWRALKAGKPLSIPGVVNKVLAQGTRFIPRSLAARMALKAQERV
ncbi:MAG TPA: SDR family oxidoreductase [Longimicrobium sp.]|nr:SDR family oxidoreductase [Longimicrobium sp.]